MINWLPIKFWCAILSENPFESEEVQEKMLKRLKQKKRQSIAYMVEISQSQGPFLRPKLSQLGLGMAGLHAASKWKMLEMYGSSPRHGAFECFETLMWVWLKRRYPKKLMSICLCIIFRTKIAMNWGSRQNQTHSCTLIGFDWCQTPPLLCPSYSEAQHRAGTRHSPDKSKCSCHAVKGCSKLTPQLPNHKKTLTLW